MRLIAITLAAVLAAQPALAPTTPTGEAIGYICGAEQQPSPSGGPRAVTQLPGMGSGGFAIRTSDPQAQAWFDYGVKLLNAFYHDDATAAFRKAEALDPSCAMCAWGEALARGPTLNFDVPANETKAAGETARKAAALARDPMERDLTRALIVRYDKGDRAWAKALDPLVERYPEITDIASLDAHAWLILFRRNDHEGVQHAVKVLEAVLRRHPDDSGAIHFYIHATEAADQPARALPYARRLAALAPGASHLVHMGGHTLFRTGDYEEVALLNAHALQVDASYERSENGPGPLGAAPYYGHNLSFGLVGAMMAGDGALALRYARHIPSAFPTAALDSRREVPIGRSYVAMARFDPDSALALAEPPKDHPYLGLMRRYARGEAFAAHGDAERVKAEADGLEVMPPPQGVGDYFLSLSAIARRVLAGRAAMLSGRPDLAAVSYREAAQIQERKFQKGDPPAWWYPVRRSLAAALLEARKPGPAEAEARKALAAWPEDPLALWVLSQAEERQGKSAAAAQDLARAREQWMGGRDFPVAARI